MAPHVRKPNPLRFDPTRSVTIRRQLRGELRRRFARLRQTIRAADYAADGWQPLAARMEVWATWFADAVGRSLFGPDPWWTKYVNAMYVKGVSRSYDDVRKRGPRSATEHAFAKAEFVRAVQFRHAPASPIPLTVNAPRLRSIPGQHVGERVLALALRLESELKGVAAATTQQMSRVILDGLDRGDDSRTIALALNEVVDGVGLKRSLAVAQTEAVRAHATGQLDAMRQLGIERVAAEVEFVSAGDGKVCPLCLDLEGNVWTVDEAYGMIPVHPGCRCSWKAV